MLQFTHVRLLVTDFPTCFRFYRDVIGLEVAWGDENSGYADLKTGQTTVALFSRQEMAEAIGTANNGKSTAGSDTVALIFAVENVDATYVALQAKGVTFTAEPQDHPDWGIRTAHFRDPAGNLIEINQSLG
jgi:catechol 2,3-dioxygenase-like lactoylglutathione lyase family enzyme